jgi:hypothetical protein
LQLLCTHQNLLSEGTDEFVSALKNSDFPTFGNPTIPIFKLFPGLPSKTLSFSTVFLGGILVDFDERKAFWIQRLTKRRSVLSLKNFIPRRNRYYRVFKNTLANDQVDFDVSSCSI